MSSPSSYLTGHKAIRYAAWQGQLTLARSHMDAADERLVHLRRYRAALVRDVDALIRKTKGERAQLGEAYALMRDCIKNAEREAWEAAHPEEAAAQREAAE